MSGSAAELFFFGDCSKDGNANDRERVHKLRDAGGIDERHCWAEAQRLVRFNAARIAFVALRLLAKTTITRDEIDALTSYDNIPHLDRWAEWDH